ncbi:MAG: fimbrillin family protein [Rikenellaceae bacterium]
MKKLLYLLASSALLFSSCEDAPTEVLGDDASGVTFKSSITAETRVTNNLFDVNDEIYVTAFDGESTFAERVSYTYDGSIFSSTTPIIYDSKSQNLSFIAAYPAVDDFAKSFTFEVLADQSVDDNYEMSDLLVATKDATYDLSPTLVFNHVLSSLVISITDADLRGGVLTVYAVGETSADLDAQTYTAVADASDMAITAAYDTTYKAILSPQSISAGDVIAKYEVNGVTYTWNASSDVTLESGYCYTYSWDIENNNVVLVSAINDWNDGEDFTISPAESSEFTLDYFSETSYPATDNWIITDASATTADFAGLSAAIVALSGSGREISLEFPNLASIPNYAIFGESSFDADLAIDALVSVSAAKATSVGQYAFYSCDNLANVDFPSATIIYTFAFYQCTSLKTLYFPSIISLENHCFNGCSSVTYAEFPQVTTVKVYIFFGCSSLTELHLATDDGVKLDYVDSIAFNWTNAGVTASVTKINLTLGEANYDLVNEDGVTLTVGSYSFTFASISVIGHEIVIPEDEPVEGSVAPAEAEVDGKRWVVVSALTDEFDTWDSTKWSKSTWNYGVPVQMIEDNAYVDGGNLCIKATLDEDASDNEDRWFQSCRVMSKTQISYPMYTECRMKTSNLSAYSTYWLNNGDSNDRDEIDICEHNTNPSYAPDVADRPYTMYSQYFIAENGVEERDKGDFDNRNLSPENPAYGKKWNEEFQTLGLWWIDENHLQFYINGEKAGYIETVSDFTRSLNIIWDLWTVDATWSGGIANKEDLSDDSINTFYIDWICTYTLVDENE